MFVCWQGVRFVLPKGSSPEWPFSDNSVWAGRTEPRHRKRTTGCDVLALTQKETRHAFANITILARDETITQATPAGLATEPNS